jgi:hypothetical protein
VAFDFRAESKQDSSAMDSLVDGEEDAINDSSMVASSEEKVAKWEEDETFLDCQKAPTLVAFLGGKEEVATRQLHTILHELIDVLVDWTHGNGKKARAVIIPQVKDKESFMKQARKSQWLESVLEHLTGGVEQHDKEDAAEWLVSYLGKRYDASFILASEALGLPLVQQLDEASTEAMWSDANINVVQQRIIHKHLKFHFGK